MTLKVKDPESVEPWGIDWTSYLAELGDGVTIDTSEWFIEGPESPVTLEIDSDEIVEGELRTKALFSGGTAGLVYTVTNRITTDPAPGQQDKSFLIRVEHK